MMEDDLEFGSSVWGLPSDPIRLPSIPATLAPPLDDGFADVGEPAKPSSADDEDDFGDFGDFGEAQEVADAADFGEEVAFGEEVRIPPPAEADWEPLRLHPMPSRSELRKQVDDILAPIWAEHDISQVTTDDDIRDVEGINQILVTQER